MGLTEQKRAIWTDANAGCGGENAQLVSIHSPEENKFVQDMVRGCSLKYLNIIPCLNTFNMLFKILHVYIYYSSNVLIKAHQNTP